MPDGTCSTETCDRPIRAKGLCAKHYHEAWRKNPARPRCVLDGCERPRYTADGLCQYHWSQGPEQVASHRAASLKWVRANPERTAANQKRWAQENPGRRRENRRKSLARWRAANPDLARQRMQDWIDANPERWNELRRSAWHTRRARIRTTQVEPVDLGAVLLEHGMVCHLCHEVIATRDDLHFDHVIPLAKGGPHIQSNIRPSHAACNMRKGARLPESLTPMKEQ